MDIVLLFGMLAGTGFLLAGHMLEGGTVNQLIQITAALIVYGGTFGAVVVSFPPGILFNAIKELKTAILGLKVDFNALIAEILTYAQKARKEGIITLEKDAKNASDPLLTLGLEALSDGTDPMLVKQMMENQINALENYVEGAAKVWESAGAYSPTFGIIGAVMGLIQVMQNLSDPSKLGAGIAVAFVATIYGLYAANLILIPISTNIKFKYKAMFLKKEMIIEGMLAIQAGESPALIERKLQTYLLDSANSNADKSEE